MQLRIFTSAVVGGKVGALLLQAYKLNKIFAQPSPQKLVLLCRSSIKPNPRPAFRMFLAPPLLRRMVDGIIEMIGAKDAFVIIIIPRG
jgi:hypothetical protein